MRPEELLVLDYDKFSERAGSLFQQISSSSAFRELYLRDPAGVLHKAMFPGESRASIGLINQANRVLFSTLSNPRFMRWAEEYQENISKEIAGLAEELGEREASRQWLATLDRPKIYRDLIKAIQETADSEMLYSVFFADPDLVSSASVVRRGTSQAEEPLAPPQWSPVVTLVFVAVVAVVAVVVVSQLVEVEHLVPENVSRADLRAASSFISDRLDERAQELRSTQALTSLEGIKRGPIL